MNTVHINKQNNIKQISTKLNYFSILDKRTQTLRKQSNTSRLLIILLIIWNIILSFQFIPTIIDIPQFTDEQNELIIQLEQIPLEVIGE